MKSEMLIPKQFRQDVQQILKSTDIEELKQVLQNHAQLALGNILMMAAAVRRLEELEMKVTLNLGILPYLRRIAYGQLSAELFITLQGDVGFLEKAASLPLPDQSQIADNKPLKVMELGGDHRMVPPLSMNGREIKQVIGRGKIRNEAEQIGWLREKAQSLRQPGPPPEKNSVVINRKKKGITVNGYFLSVSDLARYLSQLTGQ